MKKLYIVDAQRDGDNNLHSYVFGAFINKEKAISEAEQHCNDRGGKYSVIVHETILNKQYEALDLPKEIYRAKGRNDHEEARKNRIIKILQQSRYHITESQLSFQHPIGSPNAIYVDVDGVTFRVDRTKEIDAFIKKLDALKLELNEYMITLSNYIKNNRL